MSIFSEDQLHFLYFLKLLILYVWSVFFPFCNCYVWHLKEGLKQKQCKLSVFNDCCFFPLFTFQYILLTVVFFSIIHICSLFLFQPLMKRFQNALRTHLSKQDEKFTLEMRELVSTCDIVFNIFIIWFTLMARCTQYNIMW
jgi:hypothetical protein